MITVDAGGTMITGEHITLFHLLQLKYALRLEIRGIKNSRGSVYAYVKRNFGFRGNKEKVLAQLEEKIARDFPVPD